MRRARRADNPSRADGETPSAVERLADESPGPDAVLERRDLRRMIQRELLQLTEEHRIVLVLRDIQAMSYEEIAENLGLELGTVRSRLHRARMELKARLEPHLSDRSEA
jgi:RNA polymerase sigma-70 factor (ECF subfamily)